MGQSARPLAELRNLSLRLGDRVLLEPTTLAWGPGVVGLVAPNGAGKTTLLQVLAGMLRPSIGAVYVLGQDPYRRPNVRSRIAYASGSILNSAGSARRSLEEHAFLFGLGRRDWQPLAERFGLPKQWSLPLAALSTGWRQRAELVRALMGRPALVLLDEPTSGLDADGVGVLTDELRARVADECLFVVVTHDQKLLDRLDATTWELLDRELQPRSLDPSSGTGEVVMQTLILTVEGWSDQLHGRISALEGVADFSFEGQPLTDEQLVDELARAGMPVPPGTRVNVIRVGDLTADEVTKRLGLPAGSLMQPPPGIRRGVLRVAGGPGLLPGLSRVLLDAGCKILSLKTAISSETDALAPVPS